MNECVDSSLDGTMENERLDGRLNGCLERY